MHADVAGCEHQPDAAGRRVERAEPAEGSDRVHLEVEWTVEGTKVVADSVRQQGVNARQSVSG